MFYREDKNFISEDQGRYIEDVILNNTDDAGGLGT